MTLTTRLCRWPTFSVQFNKAAFADFVDSLDAAREDDIGDDLSGLVLIAWGPVLFVDAHRAHAAADL